ncbi:hypothetical protein [Capillimicrobium parvum]|uniref:DUF1269 domain-containing protein n=1 Tax=Capillimicrobium parvum TaxID=2884022 RepID=A0A9E6Y1U5_9ACTN|nr:hypothetical protein [Capillimicrobium parvum]UGS38092.1 hypothetical protein DSM104329_04514 [Capillimicrobium parvum]
MGADGRLRVYRFSGGGAFDGGLIGALERMELAGGAALLDALFVLREPDGELHAVDLATGRAGGTISALLDFRLDPGRRAAATRRTLAASADLVEVAGAGLAPGDAILAVLLSGDEAPALEQAVERSGGRAVCDERVSAASLADAAPQLRAAL